MQRLLGPNSGGISPCVSIVTVFQVISGVSVPSEEDQTGF
jgi:hypothetical protein